MAFKVDSPRVPKDPLEEFQIMLTILKEYEVSKERIKKDTTSPREKKKLWLSSVNNAIDYYTLRIKGFEQAFGFKKEDFTEKDDVQDDSDSSVHHDYLDEAPPC